MIGSRQEGHSSINLDPHTMQKTGLSLNPTKFPHFGHTRKRSLSTVTRPESNLPPFVSPDCVVPEMVM